MAGKQRVPIVDRNGKQTHVWKSSNSGSKGSDRVRSLSVTSADFSLPDLTYDQIAILNSKSLGDFMDRAILAGKFEDYSTAFAKNENINLMQQAILHTPEVTAETQAALLRNPNISSLSVYKIYTGAKSPENFKAAIVHPKLDMDSVRAEAVGKMGMLETLTQQPDYADAAKVQLERFRNHQVSAGAQVDMPNFPKVVHPAPGMTLITGSKFDEKLTREKIAENIQDTFAKTVETGEIDGNLTYQVELDAMVSGQIFVWVGIPGAKGDEYLKKNQNGDNEPTEKYEEVLKKVDRISQAWNRTLKSNNDIHNSRYHVNVRTLYAR